jgi:hypothetical protein
MREQLIQYVNLLFAGTSDCDEIREEILQNTLDRFDDLISQGKQPEAAYRLAISGIGDINEILGSCPPTNYTTPTKTCEESGRNEIEDNQKKKDRALAITIYILSIVPLIALSELGHEILGLCMTLALIAAATYRLIVSKDQDKETESRQEIRNTPQQELKKSIANLIRIITLVIYLVFSFYSGAWFITWIIFPIAGCVRGLINAIIDLKEAENYET